MFKPVKVPSVPLSLTDLENAKAEELLTAIVQVIKEGTQGASENTPPTLVEGKDGLVGLNLATEKDQHFYRQLAVAIAKIVPSWNKSPEEIDEELQKIVDELKKKVDKDKPVFDAAIIAKNIILDGVDLAWDVRRRPDKYYVDQSIGVVQDQVDVVRKGLKDLEDNIAPIRDDLTDLIGDVGSLKTWRDQVTAELENFGIELSKKAPLENPSFTGDVTIGKRAYWEKEYQVSNSVHAELTAENNDPLDPTKVYRVQLVTRNTGTSAGANYIIYANEQGQWSVRYTSRSGSSSNHPRLLVNDNKVYVATFHTDLYTVRVIGETFDVGEIGASLNFLGPEVGFQVDGTTLRVADNRNLDVAGALNASTLRQGGVALSSLFKDISYVPAWSEITSKPTTVSGFGITDAYTKTQVNTELGKKADTTYVNTELGKKADITYVDNGLSAKADIASVYTKTQADAAFKPIDYQPTWNEVTNKPTTFPTNWSSVSNKPTTISGYGITDAYTRTQVDSALQNKADTTYVDTALSGKLDTSVFNTEIAKKADILYVDTELGKKADTVYVNTELNKKADQDEVDTELAKKADIVYVDSELSKKVDNSTFTAELAKKADITYVDEQIREIELTPGEDGREIELRVTETHIQWRYVGETTWKNLIALDALKGRDGEDGRELEITKSPTHIQFRYVGDTEWQDLVPLSELKGDKGDPGENAKEIELTVENNYIRWRRENETWQNLIPLDDLKGADGQDGEDGSDGREIELSVDDHIRWRYVGETSWKNLIAISDLKGEDGRDGEDGLTPYIGDNGNWWIGSIDTGIKAQGPKGEDGGDGLTPYIGDNGNWWIGSIDTGIKAQGPQGPDGSPGREIELRKTETHIQWRYVGETNWTNLISLEEIKGPPGDSIDLEPRVIVIENFIPSLDNRIGVIEVALPGKADINYVDEEVGKKVDTTTFNTEIAKKVDTSTFNTELGKKVDNTTFNTEIAKKADILYVDTELGKKADTFYVNTELNKKVDNSTFTAELAKKADIIYVDEETQKIKDYIQSRGMNLITNGSGLLGDNTNWPGTEFDGTDTPGGGGGSFRVPWPGLTVYSEEFLPVDINKQYEVRVWAKGTPLFPGASWLLRIQHFDIDRLQLSRFHVSVRAGTQTRLAQPLKPGDTVIHLQDVPSSWHNGSTTYYRTVAIYGYKNSFGYKYPDYTYTRYGTASNVYSEGGIDVVNKTITLNAPWPASWGNPDDPNGEWPVGTAVANTIGGDSYAFSASYRLTDEWEERTMLMGPGTNNEFHPAVAFCRVGVLTNRGTAQGNPDAAGSATSFANVWFGEKYPRPTDSEVNFEGSVKVGGRPVLDAGSNLDFSKITINKPTTLSGYGITDSYTKNEVNNLLEQIELTPGEDGREIELRVTDTHIQWRYVGSSTWTDLIALSELKGDKGDPGENAKEIELTIENNYIRWRRENEAWQNLISLDELKGADGEDGEDGSDGREIELSVDDYIRWRYVGETSWRNLIAVNDLKGEDGREIEIQKGFDTLQWRRLGDDTWKDLVTLEELKGDPGNDGEDGLTPYIGDNGNWWIGSQDTGVKAQGKDGKDGEDGLTPYIGDNGNWWIGSIDTGIKAQGPQGPDGSPGREIELRKTETHIQWRYVGTSTWANLIALSELKGDKGDPGENAKEIEFTVEDQFIRWRRLGEAWNNLVPLADLKGQDGEDGKPVVIRKTPTHIEWQYFGDASWNPLVPLEEIKGEKGDQGSQIELERTSDYVRWRYVGDTAWQNLIPIIDLTGPQGPPGAPGDTPFIGGDGNWWIGDTDTGVPAQGPQGPQGPQGDPGNTPYIGSNGNWWIGGVDTGHPATGPKGDPGESGTKWYYGTSAPSGSLGKVGDFFLDVATGNYYEKTGTSTWTLRGNLKGPKGDKGDPGQDGTEWFTGPFPNPNVGRYKDLFLAADGNYYRKNSDGSWSLIGSLKGPPGESQTKFIRARFIHLGNGYYDMEWGDEDFNIHPPEPLGVPEDGVMISWYPGRAAAVIHITTSHSDEWKEPLIPEIIDQDENTAIVRFMTPVAGFYDYPVWMNVIVVGDA